MEDLLAALKTLFVKLFEPFLASFVASLHAIDTGVTLPTSFGDVLPRWDFARAFEGWNSVFDKVLRGLEDKAAQVRLVTHCGCRSACSLDS